MLVPEGAATGAMAITGSPLLTTSGAPLARNDRLDDAAAEEQCHGQEHQDWRQARQPYCASSATGAGQKMR